MGVAAPVSLESYLAHPTEPESEYVNGELFQKAMGSKPHSRLQKRLILLLDRYEREGLGQVSVEQSVQLDDKTILIPDVCLLQPDDAAANLVTAPPVLCVEILSPSDRFSSQSKNAKLTCNGAFLHAGSSTPRASTPGSAMQLAFARFQPPDYLKPVRSQLQCRTYSQLPYERHYTNLARTILR